MAANLTVGQTYNFGSFTDKNGNTQRIQGICCSVDDSNYMPAEVKNKGMATIMCNWAVSYGMFPGYVLANQTKINNTDYAYKVEGSIQEYDQNTRSLYNVLKNFTNNTGLYVLDTLVYSNYQNQYYYDIFESNNYTKSIGVWTSMGGSYDNPSEATIDCPVSDGNIASKQVLQTDNSYIIPFFFIDVANLYLDSSTNTISDSPNYTPPIVTITSLNPTTFSEQNSNDLTGSYTVQFDSNIPTSTNVTVNMKLDNHILQTNTFTIYAIRNSEQSFQIGSNNYNNYLTEGSHIFTIEIIENINIQSTNISGSDSRTITVEAEPIPTYNAPTIIINSLIPDTTDGTSSSNMVLEYSVELDDSLPSTSTIQITFKIDGSNTNLSAGSFTKDSLSSSNTFTLYGNSFESLSTGSHTLSIVVTQDEDGQSTIETVTFTKTSQQSQSSTPTTGSVKIPSENNLILLAEEILKELNNKLSLLPQFDIQVVQTLPESNISETTIYLIQDQNDENNYYSEYIYVGNNWELIGTVSGSGGTGASINYGTCTTSAGTAAKIVSCSDFVLDQGALILVTFSKANSASNPKLNVNNTGEFPIKYKGNAITTNDPLVANIIYMFRYDTSAWHLIGEIATDANVKQAYTDNNANYPVLMSYGTSQTLETNAVRKSTKVIINPSTGNLTSSGEITDKGNMSLYEVVQALADLQNRNLILPVNPSPTPTENGSIWINT